MSTIYEAIKELREEVTQENGDEAKENLAQEEQEDTDSESSKAEKPKEEKTVEKAEEEKTERTPEEWRRIRLAEKKAKDAEERRILAESNAAAARATEIHKAETQTESEKEPDKTENYEKWLEWKTAQAEKRAVEAEQIAKKVYAETQQDREYRARQELHAAAAREFVQYENDFKKKAPDYDDVVAYGIQRLRDSLAIAYPNATNEQIAEEMNRRVLMHASDAVRHGKDPAEAVYNMVKNEWGYKPAEKKDAEPKRPSLSKIEENKRKSATGLRTKGNTSSDPTVDDIQKMSIAKWRKLSPEARESLRRQAQ